MIPKFLDKTIIPHKPGVYIFKNTDGEILYVGKAIDLYHRVSSYFSSGLSADSKAAVLVKEITTVETIIVESELEALILEANLIKKHLPPYNVRLTDDKDYLYIKVTKERFPRIVTARKKDLGDSLKYFGPFPSGRTVRNTLKTLRRVFPWCSNPPRKNGITRQRPCFYSHLKQCPGPCVGVIDQKEYKKIINRFIAFMEGKKEQLQQGIAKEMQQEAQEQNFEKAAYFKRMLEGIIYLTQTNRVQAYLENPSFLEDENNKAIQQLRTDLKLPKLPQRIEGYDISNIQGKEATGSMVVLTNGDIDKSQYRRFKVHISGRPNDVAMHKEIMGRRLRNKDWVFPDLIIIDGGRGQVRAAYEELVKAGLNIPIYGLAKRMEWLYPPQGDVVKLPKRSLSLKLLQKIRDESHRFAISYHRKLRSKAFFDTR